jgi:hypothetical protein
MMKALRPGGTILDLQILRPSPRMEVGDTVVCEIEAEQLFRRADAAAAAIDAEIGRGRLIEEAVDDHDTCTHFADGAELVAETKDKLVRLPEASIPELLAMAQPCIRRDRCRLRRLVKPN